MGTRPWEGKGSVKSGKNYPATFVSWNDAVEFCKRLSGKEGVTYRLPTEAEWEYCCRAGTATRFSCGDEPEKLRNYAWFLSIQPPLSRPNKGLPRDGTTMNERYAHRVAKKLPNAWGLYDMHGNVDEWCQDWYGDYGNASVVDPVGPKDGQFRVSRGGAWLSNAHACASGARFPAPSKPRTSTLGFRVVRTSQSTQTKPMK